MILLNLGNGIDRNAVIKHVEFHSNVSTKSNFISYLGPKMYLYFHIVYKKSGAECANFWIIWIRQVTFI